MSSIEALNDGTRVRVSGHTVTLSRSVTKTNDGESSEGEGVASLTSFRKREMPEYLHIDK